MQADMRALSNVINRNEAITAEISAKHNESYQYSIESDNISTSEDSNEPIDMESFVAIDQKSTSSFHSRSDSDSKNEMSIRKSYDHYDPIVRLVKIPKLESNQCGFHLTRSKWDPYPWISDVAPDTPAALCGIKVGDCVLEVNGKDVLGLRITDIAKLVKAKSEHVSLLLWNSGWDANCDPESICCGPMPRSLQRLSVIVQSILSIIECPVCLDTIPPPAMQCQNGHLLCVNCRIRAVNCPVCRDRYTPKRALIAEQIYNAITSAFNLCRNEDKLRQKLFGPNATRPKPTANIQPKDIKMQKQRKLSKSQKERIDAVNKSTINEADTQCTAIKNSRTNKFISKLLLRKASSMGNLATNATSAARTSSILDKGDVSLTTRSTISIASTLSATSQSQSLDMTTNDKNHLTCNDNTAKISLPNDGGVTTAAVSHLCTSQQTVKERRKETRYNLRAPENHSIFDVGKGSSKLLSLSTNDLSPHQRHRTFNFDAPLIAIKRCPSLERRSHLNATLVDYRSAGDSVSESSFLDKHHRQISNSLSISMEGIQSISSASVVTDSAIKDTPRISAASSPAVFTSLHLNTKPILPLSSLFAVNGEKSKTIYETPTFKRAATTGAAVVPLEHEVTTSTQSISSCMSNPASLSLSPSLASLRTSSTANVATTKTAPVGISGVKLKLSQAAQMLSFTCFHLETQGKQQQFSSLLESYRFHCPCDCKANFDSSTELQRHIKMEHRLPILTFGGGNAIVALPLQPPVDNAVLILEIDGNKRDFNNNNNSKNQNDKAIGKSIRIKTAETSEEREKRTKNVQIRQQNEGTSECWIRLEKHNDNFIEISALLQATAYESVEFVLKTLLSGNKDSSEMAKARVQLEQQEQQRSQILSPINNNY